MSDNKNVDNPRKRDKSELSDTNLPVLSNEVSSVTGSGITSKTHPHVSSSSERQIKFERAQKCLENAALVSKRIKEHRKATAELLGRPFEDDVDDTASEMASTMSERTGYSASTDVSTMSAISVQDALNIPGISESLANTLKQKELLMERIKQYKEISKRPVKSAASRKEPGIETKVDSKTKDKDVTQLVNIIKEKENMLSVMQVKMKAMETTTLDLQEKINEKDQIIEAKNKATTLMSDSLSKKEKDSLVLLEDTREQMIKMQEKFINMESEWKDEKERLLKQIKEKDEKISNLEEANTILENSRFEISVAHSKLVEDLELKNKEILELQAKIEKVSQVDVQVLSEKEKEDVEEEKGSMEIANMVELTKKIELLEQLNCQIRQTNKELENKLATFNPEPKSPVCGSPSKKGSPLSTRKGGRNTASKMKSPWSNLSTESLNQETEKKQNKNEVNKLEILMHSLNKDILEKEYLISQKDELISELRSINAQNETTITELKQCAKQQSNVVDIGICTEMSETPLLEQCKTFEEASGSSSFTDPRDLEDKYKAVQEQIIALNNEIDAANKNMIKVKSNHKLKLKQMQKTIDNFSKVSDANAEIVKLNEELHQLSQKVAELEEEKGNLQLHLVDYDSGRLTESDVYKKMLEMENLAEARLKAISLLEAQKFQLVQELHILQQCNVDMEDKLADMSQHQSEQVFNEIRSVQLEEQIDQLLATKKELELVIENLKLDKKHLDDTIKLFESEKEDLIHKLEHYIQENMELTDKLEKLSAEKVSSAESIEIVESLTTQEKLEIEEYSKGMTENSNKDNNTESYKLRDSQECTETIEKLVEQRAELNRKIELFTQERKEVMEKMNKISIDNESVHQKIYELTNQCSTLQNNIDILNNEKQAVTTLNEELRLQIEELKRDRLEIMKESVELAKPAGVDDVVEMATAETQHDDKTAGDKGNNRTKSVKQLTKEILKLKNIIKEREAEIGDCQMKILSLEEQHQKQNELIQSNISYESKVKHLMDENHKLKEELEHINRDKESEGQLLQLKQAQESLQQEMQKMHLEYTTTINIRDARIHELENVLLEYEKQLFNFGNTLQQKDKEMTEYMNQISKLNDVSQKLKSTIELLEEEKAKDQNAELVKTLNKQITVYQKKLAECEDKLLILEEEKVQLLSLKAAMEIKNNNLDAELNKLQEAFAEKQNIIKDLQSQQQKHTEEMSGVMCQVKERDEEIHEVKLQLRKESIENEKLRTSLSEKESNTEEVNNKFEEMKDLLNKSTIENAQLNEQYSVLETKNKELMEKLKKFATTIKKKSSMYVELENNLHEVQTQLETKSVHLEQLLIQVEALPAIQEELKHAEEELNRLQSQKVTLEQQKSQEICYLQTEFKKLEGELVTATEEVTKLNNYRNILQNELHCQREENSHLKTQVDILNNKIADHEVEQKNSMNFLTKISSLEVDINQKQAYIAELLNELENQKQQLNQIQFGHEAKIQERDLYMESLETEINKYKNRIGRLEESISIMEDRRYSLERKADQLDSQLREKQKAYTEYTTQEDQLVCRLAVLMDHDRVVEKQLHEIEKDNKELQDKIQHISDENQRLRKSLSDIQDHCNTLVEKASKADLAESEITKYQTQLRDLESHLKRISHEHQTLLIKRKQDIDELESEFNTQIENAIKEKKTLSEKYERVSEHVTLLEVKLQEYKNNTENLNINIEELTRLNQELIERSAHVAQAHSPDYTEQYINEINKLNSVVNSKNLEIDDLHNKIKSLQTNNWTGVSNLERKITELNAQLQHSCTEIDRLVQELNSVQVNNEQLRTCLSQKDKQVNQLMDRKRVTFEMNIPKTEGMVISSTIEAINEGPREFNVTSIESQIVPDNNPIYTDNTHSVVKKTDDIKQTSAPGVNSDEITEPVIVAKKAYLCYKGEENIPLPSDDPFNSDEGWGLGECDEIGEVTPGLSHSNDQIQQLKKINEALKADLDASNNKLLKALKKLKELKGNNDMLSNELKIAKQIPQSSFLDIAIEDEMKINIKELEKKVDELTADINKEKREKESLKKQNEVFNNANDKLTEIKEKMDSELELWKYKFKEANDKISSMQWGTDSKDSPDHKVARHVTDRTDARLKDEIMKLEKENDELQTMIDQVTSQNNHLSTELTELKVEIVDINKKMHVNESKGKHIENINSEMLGLRDENDALLKKITTLNEKIQEMNVRYNGVTEQIEQVNVEKEHIRETLENKNKQLVENTYKLQEEVQSLRVSDSQTKNHISSLSSDLENAKSKLLWYEEQQKNIESNGIDSLTLAEKCSTLEDYCSQLKRNLDDANIKISQLQAEKQELLQQSTDFEKLITELNTKIHNLNNENDQLLSTVAELRSSVSGAVDQRGFEIAELWKQHLAQREADFQKTEQELRSQLGSFETKYEQLLDNVQSSSQEETAQLVMMEQVTSLQTKLKDKEEHLRNLQDKYAEVISQLDVLRSELEDEKLMYENKLLGQQEEYEKQILELTLKYEQHSEDYEQAYKTVQGELATTKTNNDELNQRIQELQNKLEESEENVLHLTNQLRVKESEVYQKIHDYTITLTQRNEEFEHVRRQLLECEKKIEDLNYEKESELAVIRLKMHEKATLYEKFQKELEDEKSNLTEELNAKIIECTNLNKQISELNKTLAEHSNNTTEMQAALENQELEIVTLKDEILNLRDMMRSSSSKIERHVTFASDTKAGTEDDKPESVLSKELLDAVPRAELDLALYMLHQRDVRCEELTMELTQLLDERDTLQLRLSDSLRSYEEMKSACQSAGLDVSSVSSSQEIPSELPSFAMEKEQQFVDIHRGQTSRSSSISDHDGDKPKLQAKLSELRSVRHSRDITLRHESEQRQLDLRLLHRDIANLPPEAIEQLSQAHHTLSRDSQSTSTVLLNWLRGKSTPKVVHM